MLRLSAIAIFSAVAFAQSKAPAPDGSDNDIHLIKTSLKEFIGRAYHLAPQQIVGPGWLDEIVVDLVGHVPPGTTTDRIPHLLQVILAQRFKLAFHRQMRVMNVFLLEVVKGGAKLDQTPVWDKRAPECETSHLGFQSCRNMSMSEWAWRLQNEWPGIAPIYDRTGLAGTYDFGLERFRLSDRAVQRDSIVFNLQSMRDQLQQLGLTIEQRKEAVEILVVDHCEKKALAN